MLDSPKVEVGKPTYEELVTFIRKAQEQLSHYWFSGDRGEYNNDGVIECDEEAQELLKRIDNPREEQNAG